MKHYVYAYFEEVLASLRQFDQCGMRIHADQLFNHRQTYKWNKATERRLRQRDVEMVSRCSKKEFILYEEEED